MQPEKTLRTPPAASFEDGKTHLEEILKEIARGEIQLPDFQRSWAWTNDRVVSLIETVAEGHPCGAVEFLVTGDRPMFGYRPLEGAEVPSSVVPQKLVMDGQQRLTSLFQALYTTKPVRINVARKKPRYRFYYFDMARAIDAGVPMVEAIVTLDVDERGRPLRGAARDYTKTEIQYQDLVFPVNAVYRKEEWEGGFYAHLDGLKGNQRVLARGLWSEFKKIVVDPFGRYNVCHVSLKPSMTPEGICRIYEKLNRGGLALDTFDLLIAAFAAKGFNLRKDWFGDEAADLTGRAEFIAQESKGLLNDLTPKLFIRCVQLIAALGAGQTVPHGRAEMLKLTVEQYEKHADAAAQGFVQAAKFMISHSILSERSVPSLSVVTVLAAVFGHLGRAGERHDVLAKIAAWFWCVVYGERYGNGSDGYLSADAAEAVQWLVGDGKEPAAVTKVVFADRTFAQLTHKTPALHNIFGTRIIAMGAVDFGTGRPIKEHHFTDDSYDLHHVFPVSWCKKNGIPQEQYDSILNKTPMSMTTNRRIGGAAPSAYLSELERAANIGPAAMDHYLLSHDIEPEHLRNDDFNAFFAQRLGAVVNIVENDTSKPVARIGLAPDFAADDEEEWPADAEFKLASRKSSAFAAIKDGRFTVLEGSIMSADESPSLMPTHSEGRKRLLAGAGVERMADGRYRLTRDETFTAVTTAAAVMAGSVYGNTAWKRRNGGSMTSDEAASIRPLAS